MSPSGANAVAPPTTPKKSVSTSSLYDQALAQAKAALAAQEQPILDQQAASDAYYQQRQADATANAAALAKLLSGLSNPQDAYTAASQNQSLLANGFSHGMQDALNGSADNMNATLAKLGAPATIDSRATSAGDVLQGLGGLIPATSFNKAGAAQGAWFKSLPETAALQGVDQVKALSMSANAAHTTFDNQIATLAGKLPGDVQTNYDKLRQLANSDAKLAAQIANDKFNQNYKLKQLAEKIKVDQANAANKAKTYNLNARKFAQQTLNENRNYQLAMQRLGISQKNLQLKIAADAFKQANGGYTQSQINRFNQKLDALVASGSPTHATANGTMPSAVPYDANGKPITKFDANGKPIGKVAYWSNDNTYANFVKAALHAGVPAQLVLQRANSIWPENERGNLGSLMDIPQVAAQAAQQSAAYNKMTGVTLGTSPNGTSVTWQAPKNLPKTVQSTLQTVLSGAQEYLGTPYAWGGESPTGFDCSGLAQYLYAKAGVNIPRTSYEQFQGGLSVPKNQLQAGDLVFFQGSDSKVVNGQTLPGHVGIYIGGGKFVEAPKTGDVVKVSNLSGYPGYLGARRYVH